MRAALLLVLLGGCTLFDDPPDRSCRDDRDCFVAQGERCDVDTKQCELPPDASTATFEELDEEPIASEVIP